MLAFEKAGTIFLPHIVLFMLLFSPSSPLFLFSQLSACMFLKTSFIGLRSWSVFVINGRVLVFQYNWFMGSLFQYVALFHISIKHFFFHPALSHLDVFNYFKLDFLKLNILAKTVIFMKWCHNKLKVVVFKKIYNLEWLNEATYKSLNNSVPSMNIELTYCI